jgi:hypothetical protein
LLLGFCISPAWSAAAAPAAQWGALEGFTVVTGQLAGRWPQSESELVKDMADAGFRRTAGEQWELADSAGKTTVSCLLKARQAIISYAPAKPVPIMAGLLDALRTSSTKVEFDGPDELTLEFKDSLGEATYSDVIALKLPDGRWCLTERTLHVPATK